MRFIRAKKVKAGATPTEPKVPGFGRAAVTANRVIDVECAADERDGGLIAEDDAAPASIFARAADRLVAEKAAVRGSERGATFIFDRASAGDIGTVPAECFVVGQDIVGEGQGATLVQDAAAPAPLAIVNPAVRNGETGEGNAMSPADVKDTEGVVAADGQPARPRPFDVQALADRDLVAGQGDGLAIEAGSEDDCIAALGVGNRIPQRASSAIEVV